MAHIVERFQVNRQEIYPASLGSAVDAVGAKTKSFAILPGTLAFIGFVLKFRVFLQTLPPPLTDLLDDAEA